MEMSRAGGGISWGGGEGGDGAAGVAGEADGFEIVHFGGSVSGGAGNRALKKSDAVGWQRGLAFVEGAIGLKTNCAEGRCWVASGQNSDGNIVSFWQGGDGVWE